MSEDPRVLISYEDALQLVLRKAKPVGTETVPLRDLLGRHLAEPVWAMCDLPPFDNSAVDGYALSYDDVLTGFEGRTFRVTGISVPGSKPSIESVSSGEVVKVLTGAPLPAGTGAVAMQEIAREQNGTLILLGPVREGEHIRTRGEELSKGMQVLGPCRVTPAVLSAVAASGNDRAVVWKLPRVGVVVTGDELVQPGKELPEGFVYECNSTSLEAALSSLGISSSEVVICGDDYSRIYSTLNRLLSECHLVITTGGASVGSRDFVRAALADLGVEELFWRVAIKPGKPTYFGVTDGCAVFGLPGNPVAVLVTFVLFVKPYIAALCCAPVNDCRLRVPLLGSLYKKPDRCEFVPGRLSVDGIRPHVARGSHKTSIIADADALIVFPKESTVLEQGTEVEVITNLWGWD